MEVAAAMARRSVARRSFRYAFSLLPLRLQVRLGTKKPRASIDPLEPILSHLSSQHPLSVVEIGTRYGDSIKFVALKFRVRRYVAIDPFEEYEGYRDDPFNRILNDNSGDDIFARTHLLGESLLRHRFQLIRSYSDEAAQQVEDESADLVFIDGNHTYPFVLNDLKNYYKKVAPGGFLAGHDYFMRAKELGGHYDEPMVFEAVEDFAQDNSLMVLTFGEHRGFPMCFALQKPG